MPKLHERQGDIKLQVDQLKELRAKWKRKQQEFENEIKNLKEQLLNTQQRLNYSPREVHHDFHNYILPIPVIYPTPSPTPTHSGRPLVPRGHPDFDAQCERITQMAGIHRKKR